MFYGDCGLDAYESTHSDQGCGYEIGRADGYWGGRRRNSNFYHRDLAEYGIKKVKEVGRATLMKVEDPTSEYHGVTFFVPTKLVRFVGLNNVMQIWGGFPISDAIREAFKQQQRILASFDEI